MPKKYVKLKLGKKLVGILVLLAGTCTALYYVNNIVAVITNMALITVCSIWLNRGMTKTVTKAVKAKFLG